MKHVFLLACLLVSGGLTAQPLSSHPEQRFLLDKDGKAFFWLADTGWELFHRLDRAEAKRYLQKRKAQGFNVIQAVILPELQAFESPNAYGDFPLVGQDIEKAAFTEGNDPEDPEAYDYWDHVKYIVQTAAELDMIISILPCWGEYVTPRKRARVIGTEEQGYAYGHFVGNWLRTENDHLVWMLGGDRLPDEQPKGVDIWRAMAEGITDAIAGEEGFDGEADYAQTFMTYHCYASSANWFAQDPWIDMHSWGSYHERKNNERAYLVSWAEWQRANHKAYINSEPAYERISINYDWANVSNGRFDDIDVRQVAYWSVFSGAAGHTYGAHEVWMMHKHSNPNLPLTTHNELEWEEALELKGAKEMQHLKKLVLSLDFFSRKPDLDIIAQNPNDPAGKLIACSGKGYSLVYTPTGKEIVIDTSKLGFQAFESRWFNPQNGQEQQADRLVEDGLARFDPPGEIKRGNDWVLMLLEKK